MLTQLGRCLQRARKTKIPATTGHLSAASSAGLSLNFRNAIQCGIRARHVQDDTSQYTRVDGTGQALTKKCCPSSAVHTQSSAQPGDGTKPLIALDDSRPTRDGRGPKYRKTTKQAAETSRGRVLATSIWRHTSTRGSNVSFPLSKVFNIQLCFAQDTPLSEAGRTQATLSPMLNT